MTPNPPKAAGHLNCGNISACDPKLTFTLHTVQHSMQLHSKIIPKLGGLHMRVYRYLKAKYGLQSLADRRLKISRLDELNDPFEFRSVDCSDRDFRRSIEAAIKETGAAGGVICFSSDGRSPVQWAHYANRHRGLCLGFEVPVAA